ncbi:MAG: hypothetical protein K6E71_10130 [Lachnospiraceae bacterium]|nr:hypothetical protein [Lachnospiraceae bacterium]
MINNEKIRLMTKLAVYENGDGREDMAVANYFRSDYIRHEILKTILAVTFGSLILLALVIAYKLDFILDNALDLNYKLLGRQVLVAYLILQVVFVSITWIGYRIYYLRSHARLNRYYRLLSKVRKIEEKEERQKDLLEGWGE